jgi:hypothetical protein
VKDDWLSTLDGLLEDPSSNLVTILQFVAVKEEYIQTILNNLTLDTEISCEEIIHALIQVWLSYLGKKMYFKNCLLWNFCINA